RSPSVGRSASQARGAGSGAGIGPPGRSDDRPRAARGSRRGTGSTPAHLSRTAVALLPGGPEPRGDRGPARLVTGDREDPAGTRAQEARRRPDETRRGHERRPPDPFGPLPGGGVPAAIG